MLFFGLALVYHLGSPVRSSLFHFLLFLFGNVPFPISSSLYHIIGRSEKEGSFHDDVTTFLSNSRSPPRDSPFRLWLLRFLGMVCTVRTAVGPKRYLSCLRVSGFGYLLSSPSPGLYIISLPRPSISSLYPVWFYAILSGAHSTLVTVPRSLVQGRE